MSDGIAADNESQMTEPTCRTGPAALSKYSPVDIARWRTVPMTSGSASHVVGAAAAKSRQMSPAKARSTRTNPSARSALVVSLQLTSPRICKFRAPIRAGRSSRKRAQLRCLTCTMRSVFPAIVLGPRSRPRRFYDWQAARHTCPIADGAMRRRQRTSGGSGWPSAAPLMRPSVTAMALRR